MRKIIYILLLVVSGSLFSQPTIWQRDYPNPVGFRSYSQEICKTNDDNLVIAGYIYPDYYSKIFIIKINQYGDTIWTRIIGNDDNSYQEAHTVTATKDGGCVFTGYCDSAYAIKLNNEGNIVWQKFYGEQNITCLDIKNTKDGGYIACGKDYRINFDGFIMKIDSLGNLEWKRSYYSGFLYSFINIVEGIDTGYIIAGTVDTSENGIPKALLMKINNFGDIVWEKRLMANNNYANGREIDTVNGIYVFSGVTYNTTFVFKFDKYGNLLSQNYNTINLGEILDFKIVNDNMYVFAMIRAYTYEQRAVILMTDSTLTEIHELILQTNDYIRLSTILPYINNSIVVAGRNEIGSTRRVYALRTDSLLSPPPPIGLINAINNQPQTFLLHQNYPNPFNPVTKISFEISAGSMDSRLRGNDNVVLKIFDVLGKEVEILVDKNLKLGKYSIEWSPKNLPSGIYFCTMYVDEKIVQSIKLSMVK
jgi:hypothetical protein